MSTVNYPFISDTAGTFRPLVPVSFRNPMSQFVSPVFLCLLDTGADDCVLPSIIPYVTKHNLKGAGVETCIRTGLGQNQVEACKHTFEIILLTPDRKNVAWKSSHKLINCIESSSAIPLLGCSDFLNNFKITFDYFNRKSIIEIP